jgi:hypothetical protein
MHGDAAAHHRQCNRYFATACARRDRRLACNYSFAGPYASQSFNMKGTIEIENIEELRHDEGIDDIELRASIRELRVGDLIKLTLLAANAAAETLLVRVTRIRGLAFTGTLTRKPLSRCLAELDIGQEIAFNSAHIHSIPAAKRRN